MTDLPTIVELEAERIEDTKYTLLRAARMAANRAIAHMEQAKTDKVSPDDALIANFGRAAGELAQGAARL